jgi:hypothetical protein
VDAAACPKSDTYCPPPHTFTELDNRHLGDEREQAGGDEAYREGETLELFHLDSP